ncbi:MAG: sigma-70 family RNA polymerase sigma factor [Patescibacteria group bacterium]|nr:sigma-70 family RNA polymerase sigma factor [Patescibacteria group bacterium]
MGKENLNPTTVEIIEEEKQRDKIPPDKMTGEEIKKKTNELLSEIAGLKQKKPEGFGEEVKKKTKEVAELNLDFVERTVNRFISNKDITDELRKELIQEGVLCLMDSIDNFNPRKGKSLLTCAYLSIRRNCQRYFYDQKTAIHIPENVRLAYQKALKELAREIKGKGPAAFSHLVRRTMDLIHKSDKKGYGAIKEADIVVAIAALEEERVPFNPFAGNVKETAGKIGPFGKSAVGEESESELELEEANHLVGLLKNENEREVIKSRFGLNGGEKKTFGQIGKKIGLTPERVRQIEAEALMNLKKISNKKGQGRSGRKRK